jgi:hypothetical protein
MARSSGLKGRADEEEEGEKGCVGDAAAAAGGGLRRLCREGFWEGSHAEICAARINTAAVNYHFGSKENLYVEAWKHSFAESVKATPDGGVPPQAPARKGCGQGSALCSVWLTE